MGRTLLSAVFDFDFRYSGKKFEYSKTNCRLRSQAKIKFKSGGQECPPHTPQLSASFVSVLLLQFGEGGAHVCLKFFCLRHQRRIG